MGAEDDRYLASGPGGAGCGWAGATSRRRRGGTARAARRWWLVAGAHAGGVPGVTSERKNGGKRSNGA
jgi:hypothetical protein